MWPCIFAMCIYMWTFLTGRMTCKSTLLLMSRSFENMLLKINKPFHLTLTEKKE